MEKTERIREIHRPDWWSIALGVVVTFAIMGGLSAMGRFIGLIQLQPTDTLPWLVAKCLFTILSMVSAMFIGGFCVGRTIDYRGRVGAAMDGVLMWEGAVFLFGALSWSGLQILPGVIYQFAGGAESSEGMLWMAMQLGLPLPFAAVFGAMAGNDRVDAPPGLYEELPVRRSHFTEEDKPNEFLNVA